MVTSRSDSDFERSNVSLKENKPEGVDPNSSDFDYCIRKNEENSMVFGKLYSLITLIILLNQISLKWGSKAINPAINVLKQVSRQTDIQVIRFYPHLGRPKWNKRRP